MAETSGSLGIPGARWRAILAFGIILAGWDGKANAQWGYGWGIGYNQNAYSDVNYLNQRSLVNASAAAAERPQALQAPRFQTRDDTFYDKYDLATREAMVNRVARDPGREMGTADPSGVMPVVPRTQASQPRPAPQPPQVVHLGDFFDRNQRLVWPSIAPITGSLGKKVEAADLAILAVLQEYNSQGLARLSSVTDARRKLLDYGQPALEYVRKSTTPAMADSFHVFLLSLYANVGLTSTTPKPR